MMDILNIDGKSIEEKMEKAIEDTHEELDGLVEERMCRVYTDTLTKHLTEEHAVFRRISTEELGFSYDYHFILVPKEEGYYLLDLTFSQFGENQGFELLSQKGYQYINNSNWDEYIEITCKQTPNISLEEAFHSWNKRR